MVCKQLFACGKITGARGRLKAIQANVAVARRKGARHHARINLGRAHIQHKNLKDIQVRQVNLVQRKETLDEGDGLPRRNAHHANIRIQPMLRSREPPRKRNRGLPRHHTRA